MQALQVLREFDAARVLLDIGMQELDGYQACEQIRRQKGAAVSIVAVTRWSQEADRKRSAAAGFDANITKPVDLKQLVALVQAAWARKS